MIKLFMPTRGRHNSQTTLSNLPDSLKKNVVLAIDKDDDPKLYDRYGVSILTLPAETKGSFSRYCQYLLEHGSRDKYMCIINDDLSFGVKNYKTGRILKATPKQTEAAFNQMEEWLDEGFAHCGMALRTACFGDLVRKYVENSRIMNALFYNKQRVLKAGCAFTKGVPKDFMMADFHMNLQLLEKGLPNRVSLMYAINAGASNAKGGASEYRTLENQSKSARYLHKNHPACVVIKQKTSVWKGHEQPREDVTVYWKKAFAKGAS